MGLGQIRGDVSLLFPHCFGRSASARRGPNFYYTSSSAFCQQAFCTKNHNLNFPNFVQFAYCYSIPYVVYYTCPKGQKGSKQNGNYDQSVQRHDP